MKIKGKYLIVLISMCGLIATALGLMTNIAGLFFTPVAEEFGIQRGSVSLTLTICNLTFAFAGMAAPVLMKEKNLKKLTVIGTAVTAGSTALMSLAPNIWVLYLLNALRGISGGILGMVFATTVITNWFHAYLGLATSIAMATSGIAGALLSPIISGVISSLGWRGGYLAAASLMVVCNLPSILFLPALKPETVGLTPLGGEETVKAETLEKGAPEVDCIPKGLFVLVFLFSLFSATCPALPQHFPGIADAYGFAAGVGTLMLSLGLIVNSGGKILFGILIDRFGAKTMIPVYTILAGLGTFVLLLLKNVIGMYAGALMIALSYSLGTVALVMMTRDAFGNANYGTVYPKIALAGTISNAVYSSAIGYMYDATEGYALALVVTAAFMAAALACVILTYGKKRKTA